MNDEMIADVRRFNRVVTQRVGALDEQFLERDRALGQSRLLWEIGAEGSDTRSLRSRLDLDSGYLSRLLRSLEKAGLVVTEPHPRDARMRAVRLTPEGLAEREQLDRLSDTFAAALLEPLDENQRRRLVAAMREVGRLLTATRIQVDTVDPDDPRARWCLQAYVDELDRRFPGGFDPGRSISASAPELRPPAGLMLLATLDGEPVGCGAVKFHPDGASEIKRMWVAPAARGLGLARRLLTALEQQAAGSNHVVRLETNATLEEAIGLYRSAGYVEVPPFNDEAYADHWFEKRLTLTVPARESVETAAPARQTS
jgi:DNA-binding MarR family transcriptional regulator/GNAT superfamily N-acetyltransferase